MAKRRSKQTDCAQVNNPVMDVEKRQQISRLKEFDSNRKVDFTPRPTEYRGVRYRSKCEAMFARFLELECDYWTKLPNDSGVPATTQYMGFVYEPAGFNVDGWVPDFVRFTVDTNPRVLSGLPYISHCFIEYKPSDPTEAYLEEWFRRCHSVHNRFSSDALNISCRFQFALYFGSVFNPNRGIYSCDPRRDKPPFINWAGPEGDWLSGYEDEVRSTRFDLKASV